MLGAGAEPLVSIPRSLWELGPGPARGGHGGNPKGTWQAYGEHVVGALSEPDMSLVETCTKPGVSLPLVW